VQTKIYAYKIAQLVLSAIRRCFKTCKFPVLLFIFVFIFQIPTSAQENEYEEIPVNVRILGAGSTDMYPLYNSKSEKLFLPVFDLLMFLHIKVESSVNLDSLSGFIINEDEKYLIDNSKKQIFVHGKFYQLKDTELIKTEIGLYLEDELFGKIFGLHCEFRFRSLTLEIKPDFEIPAIREMRLNQLRENSNNLKGEEKADTTIGRTYHVSKFGMVDWALNSTQSTSQNNDIKLWLATGMELFAGEANFMFNYSLNHGINSRNQQYYWRWVNNQSKTAKQIKVGKISPSGIASVYDPLVGISVTNAPTTYRRSFGEYTIHEYTEPGWTVELYINNVLIDYQIADASGFYSFDVPLVYGTSELMLKFYGPYGEERTREETLNIPFNFLPLGEMEYTLTSGYVLDDKYSKYGRLEIKYGLNRFLTCSGGFEYLSSISKRNKIPFLSAMITPFQNLLIYGEYAHGVRAKTQVNYKLPAGPMFELNYIHYMKAQEAIKLNYLKERSALLSVPFNFSFLNGYTRWSFKQNVFEKLTYNAANATFSSFFGKVNTNISTYANWLKGSDPYIYGNLGLGVRLAHGFSIRPQGQFDFTRERFTLLKAEIEKQISRSGYFSVSGEKNMNSSYRSLLFSFRWNFSFSQVNFNAHFSNNQIQTDQGARGSFAFGSENGYIHTANRSSVGLSGVAIIPFVDLNHNGKKEVDEPFAEGLTVKLNEGRILSKRQDSVIRITGLQPHTKYILSIDDTKLEQLSWQLKNRRICVYTDPNQFKKIYIPVFPMGEVNGHVFLKEENKTKGQGRITVNFYDNKGKLAASTMTESEGYFTFLGLSPGNYYAEVDKTQMKRLNMKTIPSSTNFSIKPTADGDIVYNIKFVIERIANIAN